MLGLPEVISLSILLIWALSVTIERKISRLSGNMRSGILVASFGILPIALMFLFNLMPLSAYAIALSVVSGGFWTLGTLLYYKALETEQVSNTAPTGLLQFLPLVAFGVFALNEQIDMLEIIGMCVMVVGVFLSMTRTGISLNKKLIPAALANLAWAAYWILASLAINSSGQFAAPILVSRAVSVSLFALSFWALFKPSAKYRVLTRGTLATVAALGAIAGILDGLGNGLFAFVVHINALHLASIFQTPMILLIALFGYLFYKERLTHLQKIGMAIAFFGALVIAIF